MSIQQALKFLKHCRRLTSECDSRNSFLEMDSLARVVERANGEGFVFDVTDLRQAFAIDWKMRLMVATEFERSNGKSLNEVQSPGNKQEINRYSCPENKP